MKSTFGPYLWMSLLGASLAISVTLFYFLRPTTWDQLFSDHGSAQGAHLACEGFVMDRLLTPSSARFPAGKFVAYELLNNRGESLATSIPRTHTAQC
jgi:hypothetical protein